MPAPELPAGPEPEPGQGWPREGSRLQPEPEAEQGPGMRPGRRSREGRASLQGRVGVASARGPTPLRDGRDGRTDGGRRGAWGAALLGGPFVRVGGEMGAPTRPVGPPRLGRTRCLRISSSLPD